MNREESNKRNSKLENIVMKSQENYNEIEIPMELDSIIDKAVEKAEKEKVNKRKVKWFKPIATVAASLLILVLSINISPVFASYVSRIPGFERLVEMIQFDKGLQEAVDYGFAQKINKSVESEGVTFTVNDIILDQKNLIITYDLKTEELYKNLVLQKFKIKDGETGQRILSYSHEPVGDDQYRNVNSGIIKIHYTNEKNSIPDEIAIDVASVSGLSKEDDGRERRNIEGQWNTFFKVNKEKLQEAKPKDILVKNKNIVVDNMKFTIDNVKAYPTNLDVHITFDSNNPYRFVGFKNIYMEDEKGNKYGFKGSSQEGEYGYTLHFISNYFTKSKGLELHCDGLYIMPKEKQYIEVDLDNKKVINDSGYNLSYLYHRINDTNNNEHSLELGIKVSDEEMLKDKMHFRPIEVYSTVYDKNGNTYLINVVSWSVVQDPASHKEYGILTLEFPQMESIPEGMKIEIASVYTNLTKGFQNKIR